MTARSKLLGACVIVLFAVSSVYFLFVLARTWSKVSLFHGAFAEILSNKWATAALADYVAGAVFTSTYIVLREDSWIHGILWACCSVFLGNPVLLLYASIKIARADLNIERGLLGTQELSETWRSVSTERLVELEARSQGELSSAEGQSDEKRGWVFFRLVDLVFVVVLVVYMLVCLDAIRTQAFQESVRYVTMHGWAYTTFVDNLLGILFSIVFIGSREYPRYVRTGAIWIALIFCGNAITLLYALRMCSFAFTAGTRLRSVFLAKT